MNEWDTAEYEPQHHKPSPEDQKIMDRLLLAGTVIIFLIACALVYLGVEAVRYDVAYISPIFFVTGGGTIAYILYLCHIEDAVRDFNAWRRKDEL